MPLKRKSKRKGLNRKNNDPKLEIESRKNVVMNLFDQESKLIALNLPKVEEKWTNLIADLDMKDVQKDLELVGENMQFFITLKHNHLFHLMKELDDDGCALKLLHSAHCANVDRFLSIFHARIRSFHSEFQNQVDLLISSENIKDAENEMEHLKDVICLQNYKQISELEKIRTDHKIALREELFEHAAKMDNLQIEIEKTMDNIFVRMQSALTFQIPAEYLVLKAKDDWFQNIITRQWKNIEQLKEEARVLKCAFNDASHDTGLPIHNWTSLAIEEKKKQRDDIFRKYREVQAQMKKELGHDKEKLLLLTVASNRAIQFLETLSEKKLRIIQVKNLCCQYENNLHKPSHQFRSLDVFSGANKLEIFWENLDHAEAAMDDAKTELRAAQEENSNLRATLLDYFKTMV